MWKFIRQVFVTFFAIILSLFLLILLILLLGVGFSSGSKSVIVKDNSVLHLQLNKPIREYEEDNPFGDFEIPFSGNSGAFGLVQLTQALNFAKNDPKIKGLFIDGGSLSCGFAMADELRTAIIDFKSSGKFVYAYAEVYAENAYYLASCADKVFLNPVGLIEFNGIQGKQIFFKGLLDKLEIEPQVFKVGTYKSAVEPFTMDKMSDANKEQSVSYINSIHRYHLQQIADSRNIPLERLGVISDSMLVRNSADARKLGLITDTLYYDQVLDLIKAEMGMGDNKNSPLVSYSKYKNSFVLPETGVQKVSVVIAEGDIVQGKSDEESVGSDSFCEEIRKLRNDNSVKAIVVRINSPGGSALASDVMWREIHLAATQKPVVASMSDVAASGGYYIAMGCNKIVADKNSITGSIGVFGVVLNMQNFFKNKLGITYDGVQTGYFSDLGTPLRPLTAYEKKVIQNEVERVYTVFTRKAAKGRALSIEKIEKVASGRVWSGLEAKENALVDTLGSLKDAINIAARMAKLDSTFVVSYKSSTKSFIERFLDNVQSTVELPALLRPESSNKDFKKIFKDLNRISGIQARMWPLEWN